jgi:N-glycosidase YbiA
MIKIPYYENSNFVFSNFSAHAISIEGIIYPTVEHAFHALKFDDKTISEEIRNAESPLKALNLGKKYKPQRKSNWNEIKLDIMYQLLKAKVMQHEDVKESLLATGDEEIIEENLENDFWGNGKDGNGANNMGKILMRIRDELK